MPEVFVNGPEGRLEGRYRHGDAPNSPIALVLHPHPQHGGTMNNKIVYALYQAFVRRGFSVLRFNFRGVGRSQGEFDSGLGELSDAASALDGRDPQLERAVQTALELLDQRPSVHVPRPAPIDRVSPPAGGRAPGRGGVR